MKESNCKTALNTVWKTILIILSIGVAVVLASPLGLFVNFFVIPLSIALFIGFNRIKYLIFPAAIIIGSSIWLAITNSGLSYTAINSNFDTIGGRLFVNFVLYIIFAVVGAIAGFILKIGFKNKGKIALKIITAIISAIIITIPIGYLASGFCGNPISAMIAKNKIEDVLEEKYSGADLEISNADYIFDNGEYGVTVKVDNKTFKAFYSFKNKSVRYE